MVDVTLKGQKPWKALSLESIHQGYDGDARYVNAGEAGKAAWATPLGNLHAFRVTVSQPIFRHSPQHRIIKGRIRVLTANPASKSAPLRSMAATQPAFNRWACSPGPHCQNPIFPPGVKTFRHPRT